MKKTDASSIKNKKIVFIYQPGIESLLIKIIDVKLKSRLLKD